MNNEKFFQLHRNLLSAIPSAVNQSEKQAFEDFMEDVVNRMCFLGDEYRDSVVLMYDRFYRRLPLANVNFRHQKALKSTAVYIFHRFIRPLTPLASTPITIDESDNDEAPQEDIDPVVDLEISTVSILNRVPSR